MMNFRSRPVTFISLLQLHFEYEAILAGLRVPEDLSSLLNVLEQRRFLQLRYQIGRRGTRPGNLDGTVFVGINGQESVAGQYRRQLTKRLKVHVAPLDEVLTVLRLSLEPLHLGTKLL